MKGREKLVKFKELTITELCSYNNDGIRMNTPRTQDELHLIFLSYDRN